MTEVENESVGASEIRRLTQVLKAGFGRDDIEIGTGGRHISKSRQLPILFARAPDKAVTVTNLSYNWYFHFLGVLMKEPINAMLLYPISGAFGTFALSGHTDSDTSPPIGNFERDYHNQKGLLRWGMDCGSAQNAAMVIRYLQEVAKIDAEKIADICLRCTKHGVVEAIDGNTIDFDQLTKTVGLERLGRNDPYGFEVALPDSRMFTRVNIDWFDSERGNNLVHVELADPKSRLLPRMPLPAETFVDVRDTPLTQYVSETVHVRQQKGVYNTPKMMTHIQPGLFSCRETSPGHYERLRLHPHSVHPAYSGANPDTVRFTFKTPNALDAALTALFLTKVVEPVIEAMQVGKSSE